MDILIKESNDKIIFYNSEDLYFCKGMYIIYIYTHTHIFIHVCVCVCVCVCVYGRASDNNFNAAHDIIYLVIH